MAKDNTYGARFPSHAVSNAEKASLDYGMKVANAVEREWLSTAGGELYYQNRQQYHNKRQYALGSQDVRKYKNELSSTGDLSYLNLDWKPVPIIPKFVDIVVNGMQDRGFSINAEATDPTSVVEKKRYFERLRGEVKNKEALMELEAQTGVEVFETRPEDLPGSQEELELHLQMTYKQNIEIAMETGIEYVNNINRCDEVKRKVDYDLVTLGIGAQKVEFTPEEGIVVKYVDPANLIYSQNIDDNFFNDCFYFGEVKKVHISELMKSFPWLNEEDIDEIRSSNDYADNSFLTGTSSHRREEERSEFVELIYFSYKTSHNEIHKIKWNQSGVEKATMRDEEFNPPKDKRSGFTRTHRVDDVIYEGIKVAGCDKLLKWELAKNMMRPGAHSPEVIMPYCVATSKEYKEQIKSLVDRMIPYADLIQLTHLKLQQAVQKMTPDGVYIDADGLMEIDLGNGTQYNPHEALNMYFQTGSVVGRSTADQGGPAGPPIQQLQGSTGAQIQTLIGMYNYYLNMIRDVTGVSEARDGSQPDAKSLVGLQKLAAANSNTATRHINAASERILTRSAECIALRISDVLEYSPTKKQFASAIGKLNVDILEEIEKIHLHEFGIFIKLGPDAEEKDMVEQNIQVSLANGLIMPEDAIDIRAAKNPKIANQILKVRRAKREREEQARAEQNIRLQSEQTAIAAEAKAQAEAQAAMQEAEAKILIENAKAQAELQKLQADKQAKQELMTYEFELNLRTKELELQHQKELAMMSAGSNERIAQYKSKGFESKGNDSGLGQGFDLENYEPK